MRISREYQNFNFEIEGRQGGLFHGLRVEKLMHHESRIFKFYLNRSSSRITQNMCVTDDEEYFLITFLSK